MLLASTISKELGMPCRQSPPNSHQSQGPVERFHRTLFAHIRTIRIGLAINLGVSPSDLPDDILPWIIQHATRVLN
eukprot:1275010-Amphidinium_carterae.1